MRFKKTITSLLVGASLMATGGIATATMNVEPAHAAMSSTVSFVSVDTIKVHGTAGGKEEMYLSFITPDGGVRILNPNITPGDTEDTNDRLMHFAKQIKFRTANGDLYNFASAGKVTAQGTTAGSEGNVNFLFQKVDADGAVTGFDEGDSLIFPQGMLLETDTNSDNAVDTVWKFTSTFTVQYNTSACANTMGCVGKTSTDKASCNATTGYHVYENTVANAYDAIRCDMSGDTNNYSANRITFIFSNTTSQTGTIDFGYTGWVLPDDWTKAFLPKILIKGRPAPEAHVPGDTTWLQGVNANILSMFNFNNLAVGDTIVIPQGVTFTAPNGATMTTMCKFTYTWNGSSYDGVATYLDGQIPERVVIEADVPGQGGNQGGDSGNPGGGDSGNPGGGDSGNTEVRPNRLLSSFKSTDTNVYRDTAFLDQASDVPQTYIDANGTQRPGTTWDVDYKSTVTYKRELYTNNNKPVPSYVDNTYQVKGEFTSDIPDPDGSDGNGAYKFYWEQRIPELIYPAIMFGFTKNVEYEGDDELEFTIYISDTMNTGYTLWATSALTQNVWEPAKRFNGSLIPTGRWTTISMPIKGFINPSTGAIAPIAFIFTYEGLNEVLNAEGGTPPAAIYFDKVEIKTVVKTLATDYKTQDISEVVPITQKMTFTGEETVDTEDFNYNADKNIKFIREDVTTNVVKMKMSISNLDKFAVYFVMNATGKYHKSGGIFYWLGSKGCNIGYDDNSFNASQIPSSVQPGVEFELELRAIPYYVDGFRAGYKASMLINGQEVCESAYISDADCAFGSYFGYYMHNTMTNVSTTLAPVTVSATCPINPIVTPNKTQMNVKKFVSLTMSIKGKIYGQSDITYEIVEGAQYVEDKAGRLVGKADGIVGVRAKVTNVFGTFTGETVYIAVGSAQLPQQSTGGSTPGDSSSAPTPGDSSSTPTPPPSSSSTGNNTTSSAKVGGCGASISVSAVAMLTVALVAGFAVRKNREE